MNSLYEDDSPNWIGTIPRADAKRLLGELGADPMSIRATQMLHTKLGIFLDPRPLETIEGQVRPSQSCSGEQEAQEALPDPDDFLVLTWGDLVLTALHAQARGTDLNHYNIAHINLNTP